MVWSWLYGGPVWSGGIVCFVICPVKWYYPHQPTINVLVFPCLPPVNPVRSRPCSRTQHRGEVTYINSPTPQPMLRPQAFGPTPT